jgi:hypothetical protein
MKESTNVLEQQGIIFKRMYREDRSPPGIGHGDRLHDEDAVFAQHVLHRAEEGAQVIVSDGLDHLAADDAIEGDPWQATKTGKYLINITSTCHIHLISNTPVLRQRSAKTL